MTVSFCGVMWFIDLPIYHIEQASSTCATVQKNVVLHSISLVFLSDQVQKEREKEITDDEAEEEEEEKKKEVKRTPNIETV